MIRLLSTAVFSARSKYAPVALAAVALGSLAVLSSCGLKQTPDTAKGKQLFQQKCASCHTLRAAGSKGAVGPNLDDAFAAAIESGEGRSTVEGVVLKQIKLPQGGQMPANLVKGKDAKAVAEYVAQVAATK